jgi:hypothetical protein
VCYKSVIFSEKTTKSDAGYPALVDGCLAPTERVHTRVRERGFRKGFQKGSICGFRTGFKRWSKRKWRIWKTVGLFGEGEGPAQAPLPFPAVAIPPLGTHSLVAPADTFFISTTKI